MGELPIELKRIDHDELTGFFNFVKSVTSNIDILRNDLINYIKEYDKDNSRPYLKKFIYSTQELIISENEYIAVYRYDIAKYHFYKFIPEQSVFFKKANIDTFLSKKDAIVNKDGGNTKVTLDFLPFYDYSPSIKDPHDLGEGMKFLSRYLSSNFFQYPEKWNKLLFEFLSVHSIEGQQLLLDPSIITNHEKLIESVRFMLDFLTSQANDTKNIEKVWQEMGNLGFRVGWGNTPTKVLGTMKLLHDCFNTPDSTKLDMFISRIPMISKIVLLSPHGWFGQNDVLGRPDTGGQVVYILDKVKYLEKNLQTSLIEAGVNIKPKIIVITRLIPNAEGTTCDQYEEKIEGTENSYIIRVPFKHSDGSVHQDWVSRFHIWPYLETFAKEAESTIIKELKGKPDLIVGNYSDGNIVATLLSQSMEVMQCNIAHALEKSKYLFSDLYWKDMEKDYEFSFQYTADLLSMNMASFIVSSTFQEIAGTEKEQGQYESYLTYSMPELYHVKNGVNLFHPKFNIVPPGVPEDMFFPYYEKDRRDQNMINELNHEIFEKKADYIFGELEDTNRRPIFSMARIDKVKNLSGLINLFGAHKELKNVANLILITDKINLERSKDEEEINEINKMYDLIKEYGLEKNIRWVAIGASGRKRLAEVYRIMADRKGIFVQPALFEAFGLTVLEGMSSGLPTYATKFGGPSEIIVDGDSGGLINPTRLKESATKLNDFIRDSIENEQVWYDMSDLGIKRVQDNFNWDLYTQKLLSLTRIYGFWKFTVSKKAKEKMKLYYDVIFDNFYRKRLPKEY